MPLWKNGKFVEDDWRIVADDAPLPDGDAGDRQPEALARASAATLAAPERAARPPDRAGQQVGRHRRRPAALPGDRRDHPEICRRPRLLDRPAAARARRLRRRDPRDRRLHHRPGAADAPRRHRRLPDQRPDPDQALETGEWPEVPHYLQPALDERARGAGRHAAVGHGRRRSERRAAAHRRRSRFSSATTTRPGPGSRRCSASLVVDDRPMGDGKRWVVVAPPGARDAAAPGPRRHARAGARGSATRPAGGCSSSSRPTISTRDIRAMTARGVKFLEDPRREDYGTVAVFEDLYGNRWDLIEPPCSAWSRRQSCGEVSPASRNCPPYIRALASLVPAKDSDVPAHLRSRRGRRAESAPPRRPVRNA